MKVFAVLIATFIFCSHAIADDSTIVDVHRNIPLSDDEPVYKDFYLSGGESAGLKKNLVVNIVRKWTVRDAAGAQAVGDIETVVGQVKIIAAYRNIAVAREYKIPTREDLPMIQDPDMMTGDRVDLKGAFVDDKPMAPKRKVAEADAAPVVVAVVASAAIPAPAVAPAAAPAQSAKVEAAKPAAPAAKEVTKTVIAPQPPPTDLPMGPATEIGAAFSSKPAATTAETTKTE